MDPDCAAAAADGQEQLPEHATVAVASAPPLYASEYVPAPQLVQTEAPAPDDVPAGQLLQVEAPAAEYVPATTSPSSSAHPHLFLMPAPCWGAVGRAMGDWGACLVGKRSRLQTPNSPQNQHK